jgi:hypothetical protein
MTRTSALLLLGSALCLVSPASAEVSHAQKLALGNDAQQHEMSSRHRHWRGGRVVAVATRVPGYTYAPISHKVFGDPRWPYVNWRGARDSLYAPGPLVTFVRYDSY